MALELRTLEINPASQAMQYTDRLPLGVFRDQAFPASAAAVTSIGSITAGSGFTSLPAITNSGGTLTAGVSPADPAVVTPTSLKCVTATVLAMGTGVAINDTFSPTGTPTPAGPYGTGSLTSAATLLTATHIQVASATVANGGTGGTPGPVTITGTTGTGTKVQCTGTINAGGILVAPLVVTVAGDYTATPTIAGDAVTGGALTGATIALVMGAKTFVISTAGGYTTAPSGTLIGGGTGSGTGVTATLSFGLGTAIVTHSGNYSGAPSWTVAPTDGNGSGASIATGSLGGSTVAIPRQINGTFTSNYGAMVIGNDQLLTPTIVYKTSSFVSYNVVNASTLSAGTVDVITIG